MKHATSAVACSFLEGAFDAMYNIQHQINSSLAIKLISAFHIYDGDEARNNSKPVQCMFLQEKIDSAKHLHSFAQLLHHATRIESKQAKLDALKVFTNCYKNIMYFSSKLHSIGYIHGDISTTNILYGTKRSIEIKTSVTNSTFEKTYNCQLTDTPQCYIIGFGASKSKNVLTNYDPLNKTIEQATIFQTFLFAHPFLYNFVSYPQGRSGLKHQLANRKNEFNLTDDAIDNIIWRCVVSCENYAVAASFLGVLEQTRIFYDVFDQAMYGKQIAPMLKLFYYIPTFGTEQQIILTLHLDRVQKLNQKVIDRLFKKINKAEFAQEKLIIETMINSMSHFIYWHQNQYYFPLNAISNVNTTTSLQFKQKMHAPYFDNNDTIPIPSSNSFEVTNFYPSTTDVCSIECSRFSLRQLFYLNVTNTVCCWLMAVDKSHKIYIDVDLTKLLGKGSWGIVYNTYLHEDVK